MAEMGEAWETCYILQSRGSWISVAWKVDPLEPQGQELNWYLLPNLALFQASFCFCLEPWKGKDKEGTYKACWEMEIFAVETF